MSTLTKSAIFLALTFAISWSVTIGGYYAGLREGVGALAVLVLTMAGPAIAALVCTFGFEDGRRIDALGLRFRPNWWWLLAWVIPLTLAGLSVAFTVALSDRTLVDIGASAIAVVRERSPESLPQLQPLLPYLSTIMLAQAVVLGALINAPILTFTEELGWRGYLHHLWRPAGFWRASLGTGFVWGVWHAPIILLYGLNYPDNRALGVALFIVFCMMLSTLLTLVRDRGGATWAAGIFHGTFNAVGGLTIVALSSPAFPWNGIVGIGGFIALALGVLAVLAIQRGRPTSA